MALNAYEQLLMELVNRARLDPLSEAARYGISLNQDLPAGRIDGTQKQVLAGNVRLDASAAAHSGWMLEANVFSHTGVGGSTPRQRMEAAGYVFSGAWASGENLSWRGTTGRLDPGAAIEMHHAGLFRSAGHRVNLMNDTYREMGIAQELGSFRQGTITYNASMVTENFARSGTRVFLTGVTYHDADGDRFYDIGEGRGGVSLTIGSASTRSAAAGGYTLGHGGSGTADVRVTVGQVLTRVKVDFSEGNVKLDVVLDAAGQGRALLVTGNLTMLAQHEAGSIREVQMLGIRGGTLTGNDAPNILTGTSGNDRIFGLYGKDTIYGGAGNDRIEGGSSRDVLHGGAGADTLYGGGSPDLLYGGDGKDWLEGGTNVDTLYGGASADRLYGGTNHDLLYGGSSADRLYGGAGNDTLYGDSSPDLLYGGDGADRLHGGTSADTLYGGASADRLYGGTNNDLLFGGSGADRLYGGVANDTLSGGTGNDRLTGGAGADVFVFGRGDAADRVTDFNRAEGDRLRLDPDLWSGTLTARQVVDRFARVASGDLVLDFGSGDTLTLEGITTTSGLSGAIDIG